MDILYFQYVFNFLETWSHFSALNSSTIEVRYIFGVLAVEGTQYPSDQMYSKMAWAGCSILER